jgi:hypothetical protein
MHNNRRLILFIILLMVLTTTAYILVVVIPSRLAQQSYEGAKQIGRDIAKVFQVTPEVTVQNTVVLQQQSQILELATLSQKFEHRYDWTNTWLGSTKKINIAGTFEAKAGFNLQKKFSIQIDGEKAVVTLPNPELLSIEFLGDVSFSDENGVWNWVQPDDRAKAMNAFMKDARRYGEQGEFVQAAQAEMERKLKEIMLLHGKEVEIRYSDIEKIPRL